MHAAAVVAVLLQAAPAPAEATPPRFASGVEVVARPGLSVEEVIARHQQAAARQAARVPAWTAAGTTVIVFQVPGASAPMTVTADTIAFEGPGVHELAQRAIRLNGASVPVGTNGIPRLPIVEPERVAVAPLVFDMRYRYRLDDPDTVDGRPCYVVAFRPARDAVSVMSGRAWIDAGDFGLVRMDATQLGLRGAIVSARQRDEYRPLDVAGERAWLLARSESHQMYEGPGHRTPIDRVLTLAGHEANPPDFDARRRAAHASDAVLMARDADGLHYLRREREADATAAADVPLRTAAGRATRVWTAAAGVLVDPNIDRPLPFAGVGYLDLDLFGTGTQLNAFAAGPFVQLAWSGRAAGTLVQARAFTSLVEYNDRSFRDGVERYDENVRQRPTTASLEAIRPWGRARVRAAYLFERPGLRRGPDTADAFASPASGAAHGLRLGLDVTARGWDVSAWASASRRPAWRAWGFADNADPAGDAYQKIGLTAARAFVIAPRATAHVDVAAMAGRDLDRFSRFTFDGLDNRVHGSPSAAVRFDRGLVARTALSVQAAPALRASVFADVARVRDPEGGKTLPGFGAAAELRLPSATLLNLEWSYGPQARGQDGRRGTHAVRITAYRVI